MRRLARAVTMVASAAILLIGPVAAAQPQSQAPPSKAVRIGVLYPGIDNSVFQGNFSGFREGLRTAGYAEGRNLSFDVRYGDGRSLKTLATELAAVRPDLVLAVARPGVDAMHAATSTVPIVALDLESDPVASGYVKTIPRPGGNVTGVFMDFPELAGKWLEILKTIVPTLTRVAVLWDPSTGPAQLDAARRAGSSLGLALHPVEARAVGDISTAFAAAVRDRANGMIALTSPIFNSGRGSIIELAARHRIPTLVPFPGYAKDGGLVAYGPDVKAMYAQAAGLAVKILAGTPSNEIPVERPTTFTLSLNLKTAQALGLSIPPSLGLRANEIIK
jgi:putative ABC transport system substrate-binding protein